MRRFRTQLFFGSRCNKWLNNCKAQFENDIKLLNKTKTPENFETKLFSFLDFTTEEICNGRRAYYYGDKIVERFLKENSIKDAFSANLNTWLKYF